MEYLFGIDIGGTTVKIGCITKKGEILDKFEIKTNKSDGGSHILSDVKDAVYDYIEKKNINKSDIKGIGFGVPGPVCNNVVNGCVNLGWGVLDVKEEFSKLLDFETKVCAANDANVAALGEMWVGNKENFKNVIMMTLGTGVGGGVVLNSKCVDGVNGAGGEIGHLHIDNKHNFHCNCGLNGCLETVASATGVVNVAKEYLKEGRESSLQQVLSLTCKDVFDAAKAGDKLALEVVEEVGFNIALAASMLAVTVDPEAFIIGGGVSKAGDILTDAINKSYKSLAFKAVKNTKFVLASLGNDGGMLGAAFLTL